MSLTDRERGEGFRLSGSTAVAVAVSSTITPTATASRISDSHDRAL